MGNVFRKIIKLQGTENPLLKGFSNIRLRNIWTVGKGDPVTNLKASARESGTNWDTSWELTYWLKTKKMRAGLQHAGLEFPSQWLNSCTLQWRCGVSHWTARDVTGHFL